MISRRRFITGAIAIAGGGSVVGTVASCSGGSSPSNLAALTDLQIVQRFPQVLVPGNVRIPVSLANNDGLLAVDGAIELPETLTANIVNAETGEVVVGPITAQRHDAGLSIPYYPFRANVEEVGIYSIVLDGGSPDGAGIQIMDPSQISIPLVGTALPPFETPTVDDNRGVNPICTYLPAACSLHSITLSDALALGKPIAYLVGTPAHCSTGTCSPALEALLQVSEKLGDSMTFIHAEIYTDDTATVVAPAVQALNMTYEPALFIADAQGIVIERLDAVFDAVEINEVLVTLGLQ